MDLVVADIYLFNYGHVIFQQGSANRALSLSWWCNLLSVYFCVVIMKVYLFIYLGKDH